MPWIGKWISVVGNDFELPHFFATEWKIPSLYALFIIGDDFRCLNQESGVVCCPPSVHLMLLLLWQLGDASQLPALRQSCEQLSSCDGQLVDSVRQQSRQLQLLTEATLQLAATTEEARALHLRSKDPRWDCTAGERARSQKPGRGWQ